MQNKKERRASEISNQSIITESESLNSSILDLNANSSTNKDEIFTKLIKIFKSNSPQLIIENLIQCLNAKRLLNLAKTEENKFIDFVDVIIDEKYVQYQTSVLQILQEILDEAPAISLKVDIDSFSAPNVNLRSFYLKLIEARIIFLKKKFQIFSETENLKKNKKSDKDSKNSDIIENISEKNHKILISLTHSIFLLTVRVNDNSFHVRSKSISILSNLLKNMEIPVFLLNFVGVSVLKRFCDRTISVRRKVLEFSRILFETLKGTIGENNLSKINEKLKNKNFPNSETNENLENSIKGFKIYDFLIENLENSTKEINSFEYANFIEDIENCTDISVVKRFAANKALKSRNDILIPILEFLPEFLKNILDLIPETVLNPQDLSNTISVAFHSITIGHLEESTKIINRLFFILEDQEMKREFLENIVHIFVFCRNNVKETLKLMNLLKEEILKEVYKSKIITIDFLKFIKQEQLLQKDCSNKDYEIENISRIIKLIDLKVPFNVLKEVICNVMHCESQTEVKKWMKVFRNLLKVTVLDYKFKNKFKSSELFEILKFLVKLNFTDVDSFEFLIVNIYKKSDNPMVLISKLLEMVSKTNNSVKVFGILGCIAIQQSIYTEKIGNYVKRIINAHKNISSEKENEKNENLNKTDISILLKTIQKRLPNIPAAFKERRKSLVEDRLSIRNSISGDKNRKNIYDQLTEDDVDDAVSFIKEHETFFGVGIISQLYCKLENYAKFIIKEWNLHKLDDVEVYLQGNNIDKLNEILYNLNTTEFDTLALTSLFKCMLVSSEVFIRCIDIFMPIMNLIKIVGISNKNKIIGKEEFLKISNINSKENLISLLKNSLIALSDFLLHYNSFVEKRVKSLFYCVYINGLEDLGLYLISYLTKFNVIKIKNVWHDLFYSAIEDIENLEKQNSEKNFSLKLKIFSDILLTQSENNLIGVLYECLMKEISEMEESRLLVYILDLCLPLIKEKNRISLFMKCLKLNEIGKTKIVFEKMLFTQKIKEELFLIEEFERWAKKAEVKF